MRGSLKVIACVEDQGIVDRVLAHPREKEQDAPARPLLVPPTRAPPETRLIDAKHQERVHWGALPLLAGKESSSSALNQQASH